MGFLVYQIKKICPFTYLLFLDVTDYKPWSSGRLIYHSDVDLLCPRALLECFNLQLCVYFFGGLYISTTPPYEYRFQLLHGSKALGRASVLCRMPLVSS